MTELYGEEMPPPNAVRMRRAPAYPSARTGTAQDLMRVVTRAYEIRLDAEGTILPLKFEWQRMILEPFTRAAGMMLAAVMELVPADWTVSFHNKLFLLLSAGLAYPFDPASPAVADARALAAKLEKETGLEPALLAAISHPPVMGDLAHLNFELVRHATLVLRAVRGRPCRPRLVVAIDPFALDTISVLEEGLYAGFMGNFHLGIDRLALGRGHPGPWMSAGTRWDRMPLRLFRSLAEGREIGMVLSGGVPATGRVLYGVREWARRARAAGPLRALPAEALARLRADPSFARFEKAAADHIPLPRGPWRLLEAWLMTVAAGLLPGETSESVARVMLECLSVPEASRAALLSELAGDMARETPARRRLFRLLAGRVARRRPLILIPVVHRSEPLGVSEREAWGVTWAGPGRVRVVRAGSPGVVSEMRADELAERFTQEHFA
ncbi:MAG: hypothetical protein Q8T11_14025 [Elusimicrobiota bacterium]|nr:hypothetical protein [Elusimicrobiota bacterium]